MLYEDRRDAGRQLVPLLQQYKDSDAIILGLPRGGVVVADEVAKELSLPLDVTCPRKIGAPGNPEFAIGAVTETGEAILNTDVHQEMIDAKVEEAKERLTLYRKGRPKLDLAGKVVIIIDDGLATGSTMRAAIKSVSGQHPAKVVMAVPVSPPETYARLEALVDEAICPLIPTNFHAVGQFYELFDQTSDEEVITILSS